jgi:ABC-type Na+ efflux pump permease subunit
MWLTKIIQVLSALLSIFGMFNWLVIMLSERIQHFIPVRLTPVTSYMDAVVVFGIGAGVYCLSTMTLTDRVKSGH